MSRSAGTSTQDRIADIGFAGRALPCAADSIHIARASRFELFPSFHPRTPGRPLPPGAEKRGAGGRNTSPEPSQLRVALPAPAPFPTSTTHRTTTHKETK